MVEIYHARESENPYSYSRTEICGLIKPFASQTAYRTFFNKALTKFQDVLLYKALNTRLQERGTSSRVLIMAGGTASGKTTTLPQLLSRYPYGSGSPPHAIWDTTAKDSQAVAKVIDFALENEKVIDLYFVYRPYEYAVNGAVARALGMSPSLDHGKTTSPRLLTNAHFRAPHTVDELMNKYEHERRVSFTLVRNTKEIGQQKIGPLDRDFLKSLVTRDEAEMSQKIASLINDSLKAQSGHPRAAIVEAGLELADDCCDKILL